MDSDYSNEDVGQSDTELDDRAHNKLMNNVLNLSYKQHVKKSTRTEPTLQVSEFDLVKTGKNVHVADLASVLQRKGKQQQLAAQIKRAEQKLSTLPRPLEKPHADRIHRSVAYKKVQNELGRWDPIVASMRSSLHATFPLNANSKLEAKVDEKADWGYKTDLQKELELIEPKEEVYVMNDEDDFPMSMEEMIEKRHEAAKIRAYESYKSSKARRQNKIKSKKFHRLQKRERIKQQMKEFELLQKTNPEAALEKLEEIEKARVEERMSLRHKSTGQWARSKLVRAKYDKESRQVLAQQLSISRDLTQKVQKAESDSEPEEGVAVEPAKENPDNPWLNGHVKVSQEVDDFVSGYRKFWEQQNNNGTLNEKKDKTNMQEITKKVPKDHSKDITVNNQLCDAAENAGIKKSKAPQLSGISPSKSKAEPAISDAIDAIDVDFDNEIDQVDRKLRQRVEEKYRLLKDAVKLKTTKTKRNRSKLPKPSQLDLLALPKANLRPIIDEELNESTRREDSRGDDALRVSKKLQSKASEEVNPSATSEPNQSDDIDPEKYITMKPTKLDTAIPDLLEFADNEETDQRGVIAEAFQDDDVVETFRKEKQDDIEANTVKSIDLSLPGWGSWGGKGIEHRERTKRRFIIQFPEKMKRKDGNKGNLILNEEANVKLKAHLVSEVPFPFKSVKDYEASIRAPIGSTFVPETAFRKLTKPAVTTKMGTIIDSMSDDVLLRKKKRTSGVLNKSRMAAMHVPTKK